MRYSSETFKAQAELMSRLLGAGRLQLLSGSPPDDPDEATDEVVLAELRFGSPALGEPEDGEAEGALEGDYVRADGRLGWFRVINPSGGVVLDGSVGTDSDADLQVDQLEVEQDARLKPSRFQFSSPE